MIKINSLYPISMLLCSIFIIWFLSACTDPGECCPNIDTAVRIHYQDSTGKNLINSRSEFAESNIKLNYKNKSTFEYPYTYSLKKDKDYCFCKDDMDRLILNIFPLDYYNQNHATTLIELNPNVIDTLVCTFEHTTSGHLLTKAWLNGVEMEDRFLVVRK